MRSITTWLRRTARRFGADTVGGVAAMVALLSPVLIGAMGLGAEVGFWYLLQRRVQNAADVSAHAAALRKHSGDGAQAYTAMAAYVAEQAEVSLANAALTVSSPPVTGAYAGVGGAVEVTIVRTVPRMFSAIYRQDAVTLTGRSVALADGGGAGCIIALSPTEQGAITVSGSAAITLTACDMVSNAAGLSFDMNGVGSSVSARCIQTVGYAVTTDTLTVECARLREFAPSVPDPYGAVPEPPVTGTCQSSNVGTPSATTLVTPYEPHASGMPSIRYCNGLSLSGDVTLGPGLYLIEGGAFRINANSSISGEGVVFFLADGVEMNFNGTADLDLSGPDSGPYAGILVFGSRSATTMSHTINGDAGVVMDGAIYTPASHLDFVGNAETSAVSCTQIIGDTVGFSGNGAISISCASTPGNDAHTGRLVVLVE